MLFKAFFSYLNNQGPFFLFFFFFFWIGWNWGRCSISLENIPAPGHLWKGAAPGGIRESEGTLPKPSS